jgi:hypothetical protein
MGCANTKKRGKAILSLLLYLIPLARRALFGRTLSQLVHPSFPP